MIFGVTYFGFALHLISERVMSLVKYIGGQYRVRKAALVALAGRGATAGTGAWSQLIDKVDGPTAATDAQSEAGGKGGKSHRALGGAAHMGAHVGGAAAHMGASRIASAQKNLTSAVKIAADMAKA